LGRCPKERPPHHRQSTPSAAQTTGRCPKERPPQPSASYSGCSTNQRIQYYQQL